MAPTPGEKGKKKQSDEASGSGTAKRKGKAKSCQNKLGFVPEDRWSIREKQRLLAALKTFAPTSVHSISRFVGTKTPQEVEAQIARIREVPVHPPRTERLEVNSGELDKKKAPLEAWLPVVRDVLGQEPIDHSKSLSEVIGIIGRTEVPRESFSSKLNWKNVYQYMSDLLADRLHLQSLTNLESLVILDVIHNMADTLRNSDTQEQRRLLNLKYKYLNADPLCFPQFSSRDQMVAMALRNDFSLVENEATTSSSIDPSSSIASSSSSPSSSTLDMGGSDESRDVASPSTSFATQSNAAGSSSSTAPSTAKAALESDVPATSKTSNASSSSGKATSAKASAETKGKGNKKIISGGDDNCDQNASKISPSDSAWTPEGGYCRPRYYTLNPLCIPEHLLDFNLKKT